MTEQPDLSAITSVDLIDSAILSHGFMPYYRDYYFHLETLWRDPLAGQYLLIFNHCYDLNYEIITGSQTLLQSWDDYFIGKEEYEKAGEPEGYFWGANCTSAYPGFSLIENSPKSKAWAQKLNKSMHEVKVEMDIMKMNLIFHEWTLKKLNNETGLIGQVLFPLGD